MDKQQKFNIQMLRNLVNGSEALRHGHSPAVICLIKHGYVEKNDDGMFVATKKGVSFVKNIDGKKSEEACKAFCEETFEEPVTAEDNLDESSDASDDEVEEDVSEGE